MPSKVKSDYSHYQWSISPLLIAAQFENTCLWFLILVDNCRKILTEVSWISGAEDHFLSVLAFLLFAPRMSASVGPVCPCIPETG